MEFNDKRYSLAVLALDMGTAIVSASTYLVRMKAYQYNTAAHNEISHLVGALYDPVLGDDLAFVGHHETVEISGPVLAVQLVRLQVGV